MVRRSRMSMQWVMVAGLIVILAMGGCSKKNVSATSTGPEGRQAAAKTKGEDGRSKRGEAGAGLEPAPGELRSGGAETMDKRSALQGADGPGSKADTSRSDQMAKGGGEPGSPGRSTESLGPIGSGPLQGFSKGPGTESLGETPPMMITKAEPQEIERRRERDEKRRELADIYFAFDKWALSSEGKKNLADSAEFLKQNPDAKVVIEGYCDERGSREYNLVLGEKRAKETRRYLADLGIRNPVSVTSYGKERQVCVDRDESCYWRNRRAHLVLDAGK